MRTLATTLVLLLLVFAIAHGRKYGGNMLNFALRGQDVDLDQAKSSAVRSGKFTQRLDHFNMQSTETWQQRYFIDDSHYEPHGPVFFVIGGEGPAGERYCSTTAAAYYAQKHKGIVVALEHRFYGESMPRRDLSTENLQFLSTEQALADVAVFRDFIAAQYNTTRFIAFGGSYAGSLAAYARIRFPHLFMAALASSAPVRAKVDYFEYLNVVADSLGPECTSRVRQVTEAIEQLVQTEEGKQKIANLFPLCKGSLGSSDLDLAAFFEDISDSIAGIVQYNTNKQYNITMFCRDLLGSSDPLSVYASVVKKELGRCVEDSYMDFIEKMRTVSPTSEFAAGRSWSFQYCSEYGYLQPAEGTKQPFSHYITEEYFLKGCEDMFQIKGLTPNAQYMNTIFGGDKPSSSNIIFTNGITDPWHVLSVLRDLGNGQVAIVMPGQSHCSDFSAPKPTDSVVLKAARTKIDEVVANWVK